VTWYDVAVAVFAARGATGRVSRTDTAAFTAGKVTAPRPRHSTLSLDKIKAAGFQPTDGATGLRHYLDSL
jgi:dTDP-4-dehydrorhamnose 3,5-epimerase